MATAVPILLALLAGVTLGWLLTRIFTTAATASAAARALAESERRRDLETEIAGLAERLRAADRDLAVAQRNLADQRAFVEQSKQALEGAFRTLADDVLQGSQRQFLSLAEQRLGTARAEAAADLEARRTAVESLLAPLAETLARLDDRTAQLERARLGAYSALDQQVRQLAEATGDLRAGTTSLATALRGSQVRGRWGEVALRNIVELAGMTEHCDFEEQTSTEAGGRPDLSVRLPGGRWIAVDAKAPVTASLDAAAAGDPEERRRRLDEHARLVRSHVRALAARDYANALPGDVDLVVLFLPTDSLLAAAFEHDPDLQLDALRAKVLLASPTTLVALLRTVAIYWQQRMLAEHAEEIAATARDLYERAALLGEHLGNVGRGLADAVTAYNEAVGSFRSRLVPMASRLEALKAVEHSRRSLAAPDPVAGAPRKLEP